MKEIYFIGIGGIGMSALARYFNHIGVVVYGYDKTQTALTDKLIEEGISIHFEDNISHFPQDTDMVVYTPAIPKNHKCLNYAIGKEYLVLKRAELLGHISSKFDLLAVAGTHGKTSVSTLAAHILHLSEIGCTAFLGGIAKNYNSNLLLGETSKVMVVEADEYDRTFLKFFPEIGIITSIDSDHLDIYETKENLEKSFWEFAGNISKTGQLLISSKVAIDKEKLVTNNVVTYSIGESADYRAKNIRQNQEQSLFDFHYDGGIIKNLCLSYASLFMIENTVAAVASCIILGVSEIEIRTALKSFSGIKRRFEYIINNEDIVYIDDYAHHPVEIKSCIESVRKLYPGRKLSVIFQPHLFSRTRDYADEFSQSLSLADEIMLLDIYPARELPLEGINSKMILDKIEIKEKFLCSKQEVLKLLKEKKQDIILTLGAGDIDKLVEPIRKLMIVDLHDGY